MTLPVSMAKTIRSNILNVSRLPYLREVKDKGGKTNSFKWEFKCKN